MMIVDHGFLRLLYNNFHKIDDNMYRSNMPTPQRIKKYKKSVIQIFDTKAIHTMGNLKIKNSLKKVFYRNYYFTLDELIYYQKENLHSQILEKIRKKIPNLITKLILNLILFKFDKSIQYFSRILAYYNFRRIYLKK